MFALTKSPKMTPSVEVTALFSIGPAFLDSFSMVVIAHYYTRFSYLMSSGSSQSRAVVWVGSEPLFHKPSDRARVFGFALPVSFFRCPFPRKSKGGCRTRTKRHSLSSAIILHQELHCRVFRTNMFQQPFQAFLCGFANTENQQKQRPTSPESCQCLKHHSLLAFCDLEPDNFARMSIGKFSVKISSWFQTRVFAAEK